jgi:hypothetical protein
VKVFGSAAFALWLWLWHAQVLQGHFRSLRSPSTPARTVDDVEVGEDILRR